MSDVQPAADDPNLAAAPVDPAIATTDPAPADPPAPEPQPEPQPEPAAEHGNKGKPAWWMRELQQKETELAEVRRRAEAAEELSRRLQNAGHPPNPATPQPTPQLNDAEINARARQIVVQNDIRDLDARGTEKFGASWNDTVGVLNTLGANNLDFMGDVLVADKANAAELIASLASQPEKLAMIMRLPTGQRIAELTRMSISKPAPAAAAKDTPPKQVSRAPAPPPPLNPGGKKSVDWWSDEASDEEFNSGFFNPDRLAKRASRNR